MPRTIWAVVLLLFTPLPSHAQVPVPAPLQVVTTIHVPIQTEGEGFDELLTTALIESRHFIAVGEADKAHDAVLSIHYGCDPFIFHSIVLVSRAVAWTLCDVRLVDADLLKRGVDPLQATIWELPTGLLQDLLLLDEPPWEKLAAGIVAQLMKDHQIASGFRNVDPPRSLAQVRTIYVAQGEVSTFEDVEFEKVLTSYLLKTSKGQPIGDCVQGYQSIIVGVTLVCKVAEADALLVSLGEKQEEQSSWAGAVLIDRRTGKEVWIVAKDDRPNALQLLLRRYTAASIADRIAKQLKEDFEKSIKMTR